LAADLIVDLGLADRVIFPSKESNTRFVWSQKQKSLIELPKKPFDFLLSPLGRQILKAGIRDFTGAGGQKVLSEESIRQWGERHFGKEVTQGLIDPMIAGIWAGDISHLSISSCFPEVAIGTEPSVIKGLFAKARESKKELVARGPATNSGRIISNRYSSESLSYSLQGGVGELPLALAHAARADSTTVVREGVEVLSLCFGPHCVTAQLRDVATGAVTEGEFDRVFSAVSSLALADILNRSPGKSPTSPTNSITNSVVTRAVDSLRSIEHASMWLVNLGYPQQELQRQHRGFGFLVGSDQQMELLGCSFDSVAWPQQNRGAQTRLTFMFGGARHPHLLDKSQRDLEELSLLYAWDALGIVRAPEVVSASRLPNCIPQHTVGHAGRVEEARKALDELSGGRLSVLGASYDGGVAMNKLLNGAHALAVKVCKVAGQDIRVEEADSPTISA
jgi:oxygen-dependent protoporphyrinogen oxidase